MLATFARAARNADIAVIEGMMGLFDGATPTADEGSTAEIAKWLDAPVMLVVDASGMARTIAAIAHGLRALRSGSCGSPVCSAIASAAAAISICCARRHANSRIVGGLPRSRRPAFPERHLGLLSADRSSRAFEHFCDAGAALVAAWCDLDAIMRSRDRRPRCDELVGWQTPADGAPVAAASASRYDEAVSLLLRL